MWISVDKCPACGRRDSSEIGRLAVEEYRFGEECIQLPEDGVELYKCRECGLVFKDTLPSASFLSDVFGRQAGNVWAGDYDFSDEARLIRELLGGARFDLLDVGPSNGGLLKALHDAKGARSGLDVVEHPGLSKWLRGEFIQALVESGELVWSGDPYDIVGMFDVLEHLYDPAQAFSNLRDLVKPGGFVVVETGDVRSYWPEKFGAHQWWYACLFEHHVFWSKESLERLAGEHGFQIIDFQDKRHKERGKVPLKRDIVTASKTLTYRLNPDLHVKLARRLGKSGMQPWSPFTRDHFRTVLRRNVA
jgi:SAM-dependent methyltransferase